MKMKLASIVLSAALSFIATPLRAQELPLLGLLSAEGGGLPVLDSLATILPGETQATVSALPNLVVDLLDPMILQDLLGGAGLPLLPGFVPVLDVLSEGPTFLLTFIGDGGSLLSPTISLLPPIPLVSAPLPGL